MERADQHVHRLAEPWIALARSDESPAPAAPAQPVAGPLRSRLAAWTATGPASAWLSPLGWLYGGAMAVRNAIYDHASFSRAAPGPVVSVGNITTGGTGKTPLVLSLVTRLRAMGRRPAVLTRGYGAAVGHTADEVLEYRTVHPDLPVVVDANRYSGAQIARRDYGADCFLLDDGFQHRQLRRDLDIVVVDALSPWGGRMLPAGRRREPLSGLSRADLFVISRCNQADEQTLRGIYQVLRQYSPHAAVIGSAVNVADVRKNDESRPASELAGKRVLPVCGLGNPETFLHLLRTLGCVVLPAIRLADHHRYATEDVAHIAAEAASHRADLVVTSRKDWVKLRSVYKSPLHVGARPPLVRIDIRMDLHDPDDTLGLLLRRILSEKR